MAFYVVLASEKIGLLNGKVVHNELERHVDSFNNGSMPKLENERINFIQADGDELDYILDNFENIPLVRKYDPTLLTRPYKRVIQWHGDWARFIYFNLR